MKKALMFLILSFSVIMFSAQFVIVKDVYEDTGSITAQQHGYKDLNGDYVAILKVKTDIEGLAFKSMTLDKTEYKGDGLYHVYMQPGSRMLEFMKTGFVPVKHQFPFSLQSNTVYVIEIATDEKKIEDITLNLIGQPEGVSVSVDGLNKGVVKQFMTSVGKHELTISKDGYQPEKLEIEVSPENTMFNYKLEKLRDAVIEIASEPVGATVFLNGVKIGSAPLSELYPIGVYKIKVELQDYDIIEEDFEIRLPETKKTFKLDYIGATLTINTHEKAKVSINGNEISNLKNIKLTPQIINIKVELKDAKPLTKKVILSKKDNQTLDMYPDIKTGTVQVVTDPIDAEVELFDDTGIKYASTGNKIFTDVPVGKYELKVSKKGFQAQAQDVNLAEGVPEKKIIKLEPGTGIVKTDEIKPRDRSGLDAAFEGSGMLDGIAEWMDPDMSHRTPNFSLSLGGYYKLTERLDLTLKTGYSYMYSGGDSSYDQSEIPLDSLPFVQFVDSRHPSFSLGIRYDIPKGFYAAAEVSISKIHVTFEKTWFDPVTHSPIERENYEYINWDMGYCVGFGYMIRKFDISAFYNRIKTDIGPYQFIGGRVAYRFWVF